tara:strand:+ start:371 stop:535 length:165 start_codon:yes stop_codon:yes gene_type:complete
MKKFIFKNLGSLVVLLFFVMAVQLIIKLHTQVSELENKVQNQAYFIEALWEETR